MRVAVAFAIAAAAAGCTSEPSDPSCLLEDVISDRGGAQQLHDCGTALPTTASADVQAIHDCVVAEQAARRPFRAVVEVDDMVALAYLGIGEGGGWHAFQLLHISDPGDPEAATYECSPLVDRMPCCDSLLRATLCLGCDARDLVATCPPES